MLEKKTGQKVNKIGLYYKGTAKDSGSPLISFDISKSSVNRTIGSFENTVKKIQDSQFDKCTENTELCKKCELRFYCKKQK